MRTLRHVAAPERRCLECLGQYDPGLVEAERRGDFDDPDYIRRLPDEHPIKRNENVFAFSLGCAALELGQLVSMIAAPGGISDFGAQNYHAKAGTLDLETRACELTCPFPHLVGLGDRSGFDPTAAHEVAASARSARAAFHRRPHVALLRLFDGLLDRLR